MKPFINPIKNTLCAALAVISVVAVPAFVRAADTIVNVQIVEALNTR